MAVKGEKKHAYRLMKAVKLWQLYVSSTRLNTRTRRRHVMCRVVISVPTSPDRTLGKRDNNRVDK